MEIDMFSLQVRDVLPPELLHRIINFTFDATEEYVIDGQLKLMNSICRCCLLKSLSITPDLTEIATEAFISNIVVGAQEEMERLIALITSQPRLGQLVRSLDASLRTFEKHSPSSEWPVSHTERGEELRMSSADRDRQLLLQLLKSCPALTSLDVDLGFHNKTSQFFPSTIRSLTLRNSEAKNALAIINNLPNLKDLCLRLVLDWYLPEDHVIVGACQLERFELSITGWGETDSSTISRLLANSKTSLRSLSLRNKGASSIEAFLPVARSLIQEFAPIVSSLSISDAPSRGMRARDEKPRDWLPEVSTPIPNLDTLQLSGVHYDTSLLTNWKCAKLRSLQIEDFDHKTGDNFLDCLRSSTLDRLAFVSLVDSHYWGEDDHEKIEAICREREITLKASWKMRRICRDW